jgi:ribonuclease D
MQNEVENIYPGSISADDLNNLPQGHYEGEICLIDSEDKFHYAVESLKQEKIIGFDTETKPSFKKGKGNRNHVALLQLAGTNCVFLFRLNKIGLPESLASILSDKDIIKVGVAIREDIRILQKLTPFKPENFIELQDFVKEFKIENFSLKKLAALVLNIRISKSQRLSDWEADELANAQMIYGATDAWACREIFLKLLERPKIISQ